MAKQKKGINKIESFLTPERAAATIFASIGLVLIFTSRLNLTGGAIGIIVGKDLLLGFVGFVLFIASLVLFIKKPKRNK